jgi:hypothetical protein
MATSEAAWWQPSVQVKSPCAANAVRRVTALGIPGFRFAQSGLLATGMPAFAGMIVYVPASVGPTNRKGRP